VSLERCVYAVSRGAFLPLGQVGDIVQPGLQADGMVLRPWAVEVAASVVAACTDPIRVLARAINDEFRVDGVRPGWRGSLGRGVGRSKQPESSWG
jgi:hypothetical protein